MAKTIRRATVTSSAGSWPRAAAAVMTATPCQTSFNLYAGAKADLIHINAAQTG
jgi:hypothetical protein